MTVPLEYLRATDNFFTFLQEARDAASLITTHQAYTMTQGVLQTFRRHLDALPRCYRSVCVPCS